MGFSVTATELCSNFTLTGLYCALQYSCQLTFGHRKRKVVTGQALLSKLTRDVRQVPWAVEEGIFVVGIFPGRSPRAALPSPPPRPGPACS